MILFPNCSEYVCRIKLSPSELKQAKQMAKKFNFDDEDLKLFEEHLKEGKEEDQKGFGTFIEEGFDKPYIFIRETILEQRKKNGTNA
jgi:hypothetical protein